MAQFQAREPCCPDPCPQTGNGRQEHPILAFQIYDQCRQKTCDSCGPCTSAEACECILLDHDGMPVYGGFLLPGCVLSLSDAVGEVRVVPDSFHVHTLGAMVAQPSPLGHDCWQVEVRVEYACRLQFFDRLGRPMELRCLCTPPQGYCVHKDLRASVCCVTSYTMYGGHGDAPIIATDLFPTSMGDARPHALVELMAYALGATIVCMDADDCPEVYDGAYEETLRHVYLTVGTYLLLYVYRVVSLLVPSAGLCIPPACPEGSRDPCADFLSAPPHGP